MPLSIWFKKNYLNVVIGVGKIGKKERLDQRNETIPSRVETTIFASADTNGLN